MKAVLDTNVVVSALLIAGSVPDRIVHAARERAFVPVTSPALLAELGDVAQRPRISRRIGWTRERILAFVREFERNAVVVEPEVTLEILRRDPTDNRVLEAAITARADYIVTGDSHLLELGSYEGVGIVTPARFLAVLALP